MVFAAIEHTESSVRPQQHGSVVIAAYDLKCTYKMTYRFINSLSTTSSLPTLWGIPSFAESMKARRPSICASAEARLPVTNCDKVNGNADTVNVKSYFSKEECCDLPCTAHGQFGTRSLNPLLDHAHGLNLVEIECGFVVIQVTDVPCVVHRSNEEDVSERISIMEH